MPEILIVYASTHGHTAKISTRIAAAVEALGVSAELREVGTLGEHDPVGYDAIVVGGSIHRGQHQHELVEWARRHARRLNATPSAFFSVSLGAAEDTDEARTQIQDWIDDFQDDTGWTPRRSVAFAGALQYREYDVWTRLVMRLLMARGNHPTDISEDVEYTDWDAVDAFARDVAALATAAAEVAP